MSFIHLHESKNYREVIKQHLVEMASKKNSHYQVLEKLKIFQSIFEEKKNVSKQFNHNSNSIKSTYQNDFSQNSRIKSHDFQNKILTQNTTGYRVLLRVYRDEIGALFGEIVKFVLDFEKNSKSIQLLSSGRQKTINLSKNQVVYLLCLMALNLVPKQEYHKLTNLRYNKMNNFSFIFDQQQYKTRTIIEYFKKFFKDYKNYKLNQCFTLKKQVIIQDISSILKLKGGFPISKFHISDDEDSIQNYFGKGKVSFANKFLGGGALTKGSAQEEIMFANHPEMFVSMLLCQALKDNEAIAYIGFKKYSKNSGYSYSVSYAGQQEYLKYQYDDHQRAKQYIIGIDAIHFLDDSLSQFSRECINRQILKAFAGFSALNNVSQIVTGNWGCGAFKGNLKLKFVIQLIACSLADKEMIYCPYGSKKHFSKFFKSYCDLLKSARISDIYDRLISTAKKVRSQHDDIFELMFQSNHSGNMKSQTIDSRFSNHKSIKPAYNMTDIISGSNEYYNMSSKDNYYKRQIQQENPRKNVYQRDSKIMENNSFKAGSRVQSLQKTNYNKQSQARNSTYKNIHGRKNDDVKKSQSVAKRR